jgi:predicted chitinase
MALFEWLTTTKSPLRRDLVAHPGQLETHTTSRRAPVTFFLKMSSRDRRDRSTSEQITEERRWIGSQTHRDTRLP